ncbi:unnamed protein product [Cuscuta epithymum]|uniref:Protein kinase domain-containing protein n=1 Tax=Cuscuta epithymum TaxID=186058 RepID=A0AAV0CCF7_9ASTE|nr:unnamed protein product [Cuscuta epithymum]
MDWARCFSPGGREERRRRVVIPPLPTTTLKKFTYKKLRKATNKFNMSNKIGEDTYKGILRSPSAGADRPAASSSKKTTTPMIGVVVRNLSRGLLLSDLPKCLTEIKKLEKVSHPNLIPLLGYCAEPDDARRRRGNPHRRAYCFLVFNLLVLKNGSAHDRLIQYKTPPPYKPIAWERRITMALQTGLALEHLHENGIMYRVFGSKSVLLDEEFNVRLSYSVFPKLNAYKTVSELERETLKTTPDDDILAMFLCRAPELYTSYSTTKENDVWGFGMFLCELLMGKPLISFPNHQECSGVLEVLMKSFSDRNSLQMNMDPRLSKGGGGGEQRFYYDPATVLKIVTIAGMCFQKRPEARPSMKQINKLLDKISESRVDYRDGELDWFDH